MPKTKQEKRKTAIGLYAQAIALHHNALAIVKLPNRIDFYRSKIKNLEQLVRNTEAKLEIGA